MRLAIMQPYFMPYLGYFSLIKHSDMFILFDTVQFIRHGWIERNRILKQNEGWLYIKVPLIRGGRDTLIKDCYINNDSDWKGRILDQLNTYRRLAPNYFKVVKLLKDIFDDDYNDITSLNKVALEKISEYLGIAKEIHVFSEMDLEIEKAEEADEWALNICKAIETDEKITYINPIGGLEFFDRKKYVDNGIDIYFQKMILEEYSQNRDSFENGLSIIDVLMFNTVKEVNNMLDQYELI